MYKRMVQLVGILNVTPDSFSDGNLFLDPEKALAQANKLFTDGASLVDVGAESTRPGAEPLGWEAEWKRLEPILPLLIKKYPEQISLDTYHPETAAKALALGDVIINDVTGLSNPAMVDLVIKFKARCVISHLPGRSIQTVHQVELDDKQVVIDDLLAKARELEDKGLQRKKIILDPGIGFGKTPELNRELLKFAKEVPDYKVMIGYSRKRFLGNKRMELEPNLAAGRVAVANGATYFRVHDVAGHNKIFQTG